MEEGSNNSLGRSALEHWMFFWVVFVEEDGTCCQCFMAVDDSIFDTSAKNAPKCNMETMKLFFGGPQMFVPTFDLH